MQEESDSPGRGKSKPVVIRQKHPTLQRCPNGAPLCIVTTLLEPCTQAIYQGFPCRNAPPQPNRIQIAPQVRIKVPAMNAIDRQTLIEADNRSQESRQRSDIGIGLNGKAIWNR